MYAQFRFFAVWLLISFEVRFISFGKSKRNSTIEHQKCIGHEKHDRLLISTLDYQNSQRNKYLLKFFWLKWDFPAKSNFYLFWAQTEVVFSDFGIFFIKKAPIIICSLSWRALRVYIFSLNFESCKFFDKKQFRFFSVFMRSLLFSSCQLAV